MAHIYTAVFSNGENITKARRESVLKEALELQAQNGLGFELLSPAGKVLETFAPTSEPETEVDETGSSVETEADEVPRDPKPRDIQKLKEKIALLLNKAERTDNEHERDAFSSAAERMMIRLGITAAELESAGEVKPEEIIEVRKQWRGNYSIVFIPFTDRVAFGFGNLTVLQSHAGAPMLRTSYIIGHQSDVEQFMVLLASLESQVMSALTRFQKAEKFRRRSLTDMERYVENRSFIDGFGLMVARRLADMRTVEVKKVAGSELVLANRKEKVTAKVNEMYPIIDSIKSRKTEFSPTGYSAGIEQGSAATLTNQKAVNS